LGAKGQTQTMMGQSSTIAPHGSAHYLNRELSWVALYRRLLYEAADDRWPLLTRLTRLAQVSSYLDEYFMVRAAALKQAIAQAQPPPGPDGLPAQAILQRLRAGIWPLLQRQQSHFTQTLQPALAQRGIALHNYRELSPEQQARIDHRFAEDIAPLLRIPRSGGSEDWPEFSNLSLTLAVGCQGEGGDESAPPHVLWVKVPRSLPRFLATAPFQPGQPWVAVPLEQAIAAQLDTLLPHQSIQWWATLRVTRSAQFDRDDPDADNLMAWVEENLHQRRYQGTAVRLEIAGHLPPALQSDLQQSLELTSLDCYRVPGWLAYGDLVQVADLPQPDLKLPPLQPTVPPSLASAQPERSWLATPSPTLAPPPSLFPILQQQDVLVHLPHHDFGATVERFVAEAAADPQVLALKLTLYRTAGDAPIVRSLLQAAKDGKQVVVLVELTAPLDEETNLHWARRLEAAGAHVVYGVVGLKTHTNLALAIRRQGQTVQRYAYIGTGDYLPHRLQPYADLGLLTSHSGLGQDLGHLFNFLTGYSRHRPYEQLLVAPVALRARLLDLIQQETRQVQAGTSGRIIAKLNVLADPTVISALYHASQAGVQVDLIVRGVCCLRPGVPGLSDRIRVVSILGCYVEHSRILYCQNGDRPIAYLGSADWTPRGLDQRIEVLAPILSPTLKAEIKTLLENWLTDTHNAWTLQPDGRYVLAASGT
jgi:polyphosphate kinase